ncbi:MAG: FecR domain-containing protein [Ginsengibacter sp.]
MSTERIEYLVELFFSNNITERQKEELSTWVSTLDDSQIQTLLEKAWQNHVPDTRIPGDISEKIISTFIEEKSRKAEKKAKAPVIKLRPPDSWWKVAGVAACLCAMIIAILVIQGRPKKIALVKALPGKTKSDDVKPGGHTAVLTLADGTRILLDSTSNGFVSMQGNTKVMKQQGAVIAYNKENSGRSELSYNTMSTPAGGMYELILSDGTKAWLNASSSIHFPIEFTTNERRVSITGEVYFEVAKNAGKPFIVTVNKLAEVKVLGTHFNLNAYDNENEIKTTLLEGSISVTKGTNSETLTAGQQARINKNGSIKKLSDVDLEEAVAWKNGKFIFNGTELQEVLRQAARWYNLEVVYEGKIPDDKFSGQVSRSVSLSSLLKWMQWSEVYFKLEGRKLIIKQ